MVNVRLVLGNSLSSKVLDSIEDGSVDLLLTDPPFGGGISFLEQWVPPYVGKLRDTGVFVSFYAVERVTELVDVLREADLKIRCIGVWHCPDFYGEGEVNYGGAIIVIVVATRNRGMGHHCGLDKHDQRFFLTEASRCSGGEELGHPCQKPVDVVLPLVQNWSFIGDTVLDPFMGSGTTGEAAIRLGREFIGIEERGDYFESASGRLGDVSFSVDDISPMGVRA